MWVLSWHVHTFTSTILVFLFQSQTDSMCSLESSITHRNVPASCAKNIQTMRDAQNIHVHHVAVPYVLYDCYAICTALEKATDPTPRSNVPSPICCSVVSVVESQMWTNGCKGW